MRLITWLSATKFLLDTSPPAVTLDLVRWVAGGLSRDAQLAEVHAVVPGVVARVVVVRRAELVLVALAARAPA